MDLGRYQHGQWIVLRVVVLDNLGRPVVPASSPVALLTGASGPSVSVPMWSVPEAVSTYPSGTAFQALLFLNSSFNLGIYGVEYLISGDSIAEPDVFTVVGGGDSGGRVVSMYAYDRPEATYVIAQLDSGLIVQGKNPRL